MYIYIYLYIYNHTNNVQPKLSNWHTSHLCFIYPNKLGNLDKLLRPTSEHDSPTSTHVGHSPRGRSSLETKSPQRKNTNLSCKSPSQSHSNHPVLILVHMSHPVHHTQHQNPVKNHLPTWCTKTYYPFPSKQQSSGRKLGSKHA